MITVELRLFGAFRKYSEDSSISIEIPQKNCRVSALKEGIASELVRRRPDLKDSNKLVFESALANEKEVLRDNDEIQSSCTLAILPPVCGG